jgi:hypothetical protein
MNQPTECKYCGCEEIATTTDSEIVFRCWSSYLTADDYWTVSNNCGARCAVQLVELRERIQQDIEFMKAREANFVTALRSRLRTLNERIKRAVEVLEGATRYDFIASYMPHMDKRSDGEFLEHEQAEQVIEILKGETDGQTD